MSKLKNKEFVQPLFLRDGFTLLEVMLAVTILSVGLVMVVRSYATSLYTLKTTQNYLVANLILEEKTWQKQEERSRIGGIIPEEEQNHFEPPFDNFSYKMSFEEEEDLPSLYKSTFAVFWQQRNEKRSISCVNYMQGREE